jgi:hypothetical protein
MITFLLYIFLLIYLFEFYNYVIRFKKQILQKDNKKIIEDFEASEYCKVLPSNYIDQSENVLDPPMISHEALKKVAIEEVPLPADDTRVYFNKDFEKLATYTLPPRHIRDPRWHCLRDYMICSTPYNYIDAHKTTGLPSTTVMNFRNRNRNVKSEKNKN